MERNMDESRKAFEQWINSLPMHSAERHRIDSDRYRFNTTEVAWKAWLASRASIEIELPDWDMFDTTRQVLGAVEDELRAAGIKVKE